MYAIVSIAGVQVKASPEEILDVPRLAAEPGGTVEFKDVLLVSDGSQVTVGQPHVAGASLTAVVLEHRRGPKVIVGTFRRRKDSKKKKGHRQDFTRLRVTGIKH
jgi:large subunit ribosomal protein L21